MHDKSGMSENLCDPSEFDWTWHTARKAGRCMWVGCRQPIEPGHRYVQGEMKFPHPFARERYCANHFIPEARHA